MPSFADSAVIFILALILFGPKRLPQLARQLGKLMAEFRRASNDFRFQMEEELRVVEQEDAQKKLIAAETKAPEYYPESSTLPAETSPAEANEGTVSPIATSGDITMMPPSSGLPLERSRSNASSNAGVIATAENTTLDSEAVHD